LKVSARVVFLHGIGGLYRSVFGKEMANRRARLAIRYSPV
jgi:hypothetical protein